MKGHAKKYFLVTGICVKTKNLLTYGVFTTSKKEAIKTIEENSYIKHEQLIAHLGQQ